MFREISLILCACDAIASAQNIGDATTQQLSNKLADAIEQIPEQAPSADAQRLAKDIAQEIQVVRAEKQQRALASLEQAAISADKKALISSFEVNFMISSLTNPLSGALHAPMPLNYRLTVKSKLRTFHLKAKILRT